MSEYLPERERLRSNLLRLVEAYGDHGGYTPLTAMQKALGTTTPQTIFVPNTDVKAGNYDKWVEKFSASWPSDLPWPEGIVRPPADVASAAA